jgi:hypothetical protein
MRVLTILALALSLAGCNGDRLKQSMNGRQAQRGRPVTTGTGTIVGVRMLDGPLAALDIWMAAQKEPDLTRPEAIGRLVEIGLKVKK